jgi:choline kinase
MQAILYAAGVGMRLRSVSGDRPKILLEFAGKSLLERHLQCLREVGVGCLTIVSGYRQELIQEVLPGLRQRYGMEIEQLINPHYTDGSILSLATSIPTLQTLARSQPGLLMDGDVLYPAEFLRRLLESPHQTALLVDRDYSTADDDPVLVPIANGRPFDFVKKWQGEAEQIGESVGFFKVSPDDLPEMIRFTQNMSVGPGRAASYDDVLRKLVQAGRFGHEDITGLPWTEIDFPGDVERASLEILPAIERLQRRSGHSGET